MSLMNSQQQSDAVQDTEALSLFKQLPDDAASQSTASTLVQSPVTLEQTGVSPTLLMDLLIKQMYLAQVSTIESLCQSICLPGRLVQELLMQAKQMMWVENRAASAQARFSLSGSGKSYAESALQQSGYTGPSPVSLQTYQKVVKAQSHRNTQITRSLVDTKLADESFEPQTLDAIGMSLNSTKPVLLYGLPGTGKSYLCRQLIKVFDDSIYMPYAVEVNQKIIQLYDPQVHHRLTVSEQHADLRYQQIQRPLIVTGGELTLDMLEVSFDHAARLYKAPLQMKANNGVLLLDDLGRQRLSPTALINRWIIPLEENKDYLSLSDGTHFEVPFELMMLFSTNLAPKELVDDAFLRRLGYKIKMHPMSLERYLALWHQVSDSLGLECDESVMSYLLTECHGRHNRHFLPCYPRDLLNIVKDATLFWQLPPTVTPELIDNAWRHYFVTATKGQDDE